jgi:hypothetical protein
MKQSLKSEVILLEVNTANKSSIADPIAQTLITLGQRPNI